MVLETSASSRQLLVLTERFHSGWRAKEDDASRDAVRVYGDFLGCVVEAGTHRVTFAFAPDSARQGLQFSLAGLSLTVVLTALMGFERSGRAVVQNHRRHPGADDLHVNRIEADVTPSRISDSFTGIPWTQ